MGQGRDPERVEWLLFGLGNPGARYENTPHNLGWMFLDEIGRRNRARWFAGRADYIAARVDLRDERIHLIKPTTYMNLSGRAVKQYLAIEKPNEPKLVVAVDDVNLPLGRLRMRPRGSSGGHNGLTSIEQHLHTKDYARIRLGCGPVPEGEDMSDFVLEEFRRDDQKAVEEMVGRAADAFESWVLEGPETTMGRFNG